MQTSDNYAMTIAKAFHRHYTEQSDVWTGDIGMRILPLLIQGKLRLSGNGRILDIGCGSGQDTHVYSPLSLGVTGVDIYAHPEWKAISGHYDNVNFYHGDFLSCPLNGHYQVIVDNGCFHHQKEESWAEYLEKAHQFLSPQGHFILSTFCDDRKPTYQDSYARIHHYFSDDQLADILNRAGFHVVETTYIYRPTHENYYRISFCQKA
ncbi:class I SAM-dependent methyltransferase [Serratia sp. L9]|uniref:class I SAM-dependent methyltransferase n=1 Tax=Serratia sp. L9 TaxID=3423946 RepID=UPI003D67636A